LRFEIPNHEQRHDRPATRRRSREEIIELFRVCAAKLGRTLGKAEFERTCGVSETIINRHFWKSGYAELAEAAGLPPNTLKRPPFDPSDQSVPTIFERRTADAFRCLGFEISQFGQGAGRNADALALAPRERFAVIIDAKVRSTDYVLGTEDRKFLEYARNHGAELQLQGYANLYFAVVGSAFKEGDLRRLTDAQSSSPIRTANLISAKALMCLVENSIRDRSKFSLTDFERQLFAHKIIET
jgi:hypothetical protein